MPRGRTPAVPPGDVISARIKQARQGRGWKQRDLVERLAGVGYRMTQAAISRIETGQQKVTVEDLFGLAAALGVAPINLMTPLDGDAPEIGVTATISRSGPDVRQWVRGEEPLDAADERTYFDVEVPAAEQRNRRRYPEFERLKHELGMLYAVDDPLGLPVLFFDQVRDELDVLQRRIIAEKRARETDRRLVHQASSTRKRGV